MVRRSPGARGVVPYAPFAAGNKAPRDRSANAALSATTSTGTASLKLNSDLVIASRRRCVCAEGIRDGRTH
jgi:hypothetical protein